MAALMLQGSAGVVLDCGSGTARCINMDSALVSEEVSVGADAQLVAAEAVGETIVAVRGRSIDVWACRS